MRGVEAGGHPQGAPIGAVVVGGGHGHSRVGWARDYISLQYKAQLTFPPGFSTPRLFLCLLGFREACMLETQAPTPRHYYCNILHTHAGCGQP
jgi:hypothetical protein